MNKPLSKLQQFKAARLVPRCKVLRLHRELAALEHDIVVAMTYAAMQRRANAHNVAVRAYAPAPRASPAIH